MQALPDIVHFQCPRCPHKLPGTRPAFRLNNLDYRLWCNQCRRCLFVKHWQCHCHISWHLCPQHRGEPDRLRAAQAATQPPNPHPPAAQAKVAPARRKAHRELGQGRDSRIQQWLDQPPPKRARAEPAEIELGTIHQDDMPRQPKHHMLGPKLRAKFPRIEPTASHTNSF